MNFRASSAFLPMAALLLLSGCDDAGDSRAKRFHTEASRAMALCKNGDKSYEQVLELHQWAAARIDRILKDFPSSEIALGLTSGRTTISGLTLDQFREMEATLKPLAAAENDPLACALLMANSMEDASDTSSVLVDLAGKVAESGKKELALQLLAQAFDGVKTMEDTWLDSGVSRVLAVNHAVLGDFGKALDMARTIVYPEHEAMALAEIAVEYAKTGQRERASQILSQSLEMARKLDRWYDSAKIGNSTELAFIAGKYAEAGDINPALETVRMLDDEMRASMLLSEIAGKVAADGQREQALEILKEALATAKRESHGPAPPAFHAIAGKYAELGAFDEALAAVRMIADSGLKSRALAGIAGEAAKAGQNERASRLLLEAHDLANTLTTTHKPGILGVIAVKHAEAGEAAKASQILSQAIADVKNWSNKEPWVVRQIAIDSAEIGDMAQALETTETLEEPEQKYLALVGIAGVAAKTGKKELAARLLEQAVETTESIKGGNGKALAMAGIAIEFAKIGQTEQALQLLSQALDAARTREIDWQKLSALARIAVKYAELGDFNNALETANTMEDAFERTEALTEIASKVAAAGQNARAVGILSQARETARTLKEDWQIASTLTDIAGGYAEAGDFEQAIETAGTITDPQRASSALAGIAIEYARIGRDEQASRLLNQAVETAWKIDGARYKEFALSDISSALTVVEQKNRPSRLVARAIELARTIEEPQRRSWALTEIAFSCENTGNFLQAIEAVKSEVGGSGKTAVFCGIAAKVVQPGEKDKATLQSITRTVRPMGELWE